MIDSILNKLSEVAERFKEIEALLSQPDVTRDQKRYISLTKEYSELSPVVEAYTEISSIQQAIKEASQMAQDKDEDIQQLAESELEDLKKDFALPIKPINLNGFEEKVDFNYSIWNFTVKW